MTKPRRSSTKSKNAKRRSSPDVENYLLEIKDWEMKYSLSAGAARRFSRGGITEHAHLHIATQLVHPRKLEGRSVMVILIGDRDYDALLNRPDQGGEAEIVGGLRLKGQHGDYYGSVPASAIWGLVSGLAAQKFKVVTMSGEPLRYGSSRIRWISLDRDYEPEDFP